MVYAPAGVNDVEDVMKIVAERNGYIRGVVREL